MCSAAQVCAVASDTTTIVTGSFDNTCRIWGRTEQDKTPPPCKFTLRHPGSVYCLCLSEGLLATGSYDWCTPGLT